MQFWGYLYIPELLPKTSPAWLPKLSLQQLQFMGEPRDTGDRKQGCGTEGASAWPGITHEASDTPQVPYGGQVNSL